MCHLKRAQATLLKRLAIKSLLSSCLIFGLNPASAADGPDKVHQATDNNAPVAAQESGVQLKRKVAIARFSNETVSGATFLIDNSGDRIGKQASDILSTRLTETGLFLMFERIDSGKTDAEQALAGLQETGVAADYLIVGSVSEFGRSTESDTGVFSRKKIQKAYAKVNVRLLDVATGRIVFASEGAGEASSEAKRVMGVGSSAGYDQSLTDKSLSAAISQLISNLVEKMTNKPWKSYLLQEQDGLYIMAGGASQGLKPGMTLAVFKNGKDIINPQTGATITLPGQKVGAITVASSVGDDEFNELSFVTLTSGKIDQPLDQYYIAQE